MRNTKEMKKEKTVLSEESKSRKVMVGVDLVEATLQALSQAAHQRPWAEIAQLINMLSQAIQEPEKVEKD